MHLPLDERRAALERFFAALDRAGASRFVLTPYTRSLQRAEDWLARAGGALDGVVAKRVDGAYHPGERAMLKVKRLRTADCVVGGYRLGSCAGGRTKRRGNVRTSSWVARRGRAG